MWSEEWYAASSAAGNAVITKVLQPVSRPQRALIAPTLLRQANVCMGWTFVCNLTKVAFLGPARSAGPKKELAIGTGIW